MPFIQLEIAKATIEQKEELISKITTDASEVLGLPAEAFYVLIKENELENWGVGGKILPKHLAQKAKSEQDK
jgi:4-oxalocrotonate tautomerase